MASAFYSTYTQEDLERINKDLNANDKIKYYFTSEDLVGLQEYFNNNNQYTIKGLVQYFNSKLVYNRIADLLELMISKGIELIPKLVFKPVTEKHDITEGKFIINETPYQMSGSFFINNLIVVKNTDGSYDFFDNPSVDIETREVDLGDENINGTATVSYFVLQTDILQNAL